MKSMIYYMAEALSKVGEGLYIVISPIIGVLGAFISGSNTVAVGLAAVESAANGGMPVVPKYIK